MLINIIIGFLLMVTPSPAVRAEPPQSVAPASSPCPEWFATALQAGFNEQQWPTVARIMRCESGCHPWAHNASGASGLMQIMPFWWKGRDPYDSDTNLIMAKEVYDQQGWPAWSCY